MGAIQLLRDADRHPDRGQPEAQCSGRCSPDLSFIPMFAASAIFWSLFQPYFLVLGLASVIVGLILFASRKQISRLMEGVH